MFYLYHFLCNLGHMLVYLLNQFLILYLQSEFRIRNMKPQLLISSANSSSGKTLFAMGLLRLLKKRGLKVQSYKCGPDFIDAQQLSIAADNETVNLDAWMSSHSHVQFLYNKYGSRYIRSTFKS